jgi:hypothetical protein
MRFHSLSLAAILLLGLYSAPLVEAVDADMLAMALAPRGLSVFSDKEEDPSSKTEINVAPVDTSLNATFSVPENKGLGYQYAGFVIWCNGMDIRPYTAIRIVYSCAQGSLSAVQLEAADRTRENLGVNGDEAAVVDGWSSLVIPISDYSMMGEEQLTKMNKLAFMFSGIEGSVTFKEISFVSGAVAVKTSAYAKDRRFTFQRGHGAWVYAAKPEFVQAIKAYNKRAATDIRYLFAYSASIGLDMEFNDDAASFYAKELGESGVAVYAMIDGTTSTLSAMSEVQIDQMAHKIADHYNALGSIAGVQLDVEPFTKSCTKFYALLKQYLSKPLSAAVGAWSCDLLAIVDLPVLMGYDLGNSPEAFSSRAAALYKRFADSCEEAQAYYLIGLPLIATHNEYEYRIRLSDKAREKGGGTMQEFFDKGLSAVRNRQDGKHYVGISIWAFLDAPVGYREAYQWYPYTITQEQWDMLAKLE